jgi:hypothetical protein
MNIFAKAAVFWYVKCPGPRLYRWLDEKWMAYQMKK